MPQSPQLLTSVDTSVHEPPHIFWFDWQLVEPPLPLPAVPFEPPVPGELEVAPAQAAMRKARPSPVSQIRAVFITT
jgi:hypothetical protein